MSVFKHPALIQEGKYQFDIGGGRLIQATPAKDDDMFNVRCVNADGKIIMEGMLTSESIDALFDGWAAVVETLDNYE